MSSFNDPSSPSEALSPTDAELREVIEYSRLSSPPDDSMEEPTTLEAYLDFSRSVGFLEGHFPSMPIWPGALLLQIAQLAMDEAAGARHDLHEIREAKFLRPIAPSCKLTLLASLRAEPQKPAIVTLKGSIIDDTGSSYAKFSLKLTKEES